MMKIGNMIKITSLLKGITFFLGMFFLSIAAQAQTQIGGASLPLKYSIHRYTVTMGSALNSFTWAIYDDGATRETIDNGTSVAYSNTTAYRIDEAPSQTAGVASISIDFTGSLSIGVAYTLVYMEKSSDDCYTYEFFPFVIQDPLDVDLDPNDLISDHSCPDSNLVYLEGSGALDIPATYTSVDYQVVITDPDGVSDVYTPQPETATNIHWSFNFQVTVTGVSGTSAQITEINHGATNLIVNNSVYISPSPVVVSNLVTNYTVRVTYRDVPGIQQQIEFRLTQIEGSYQEDDVDVMIPMAGENEMVHYIDRMPGPSYIAALD